MRNGKRQRIAVAAGLLGAGALIGLAQPSSAVPRNVAPRSNDVREVRRDVKDARKDVKDARQDLRREKKQLKQEKREDRRDNRFDDNRFNGNHFGDNHFGDKHFGGYGFGHDAPHPYNVHPLPDHNPYFPHR